ncbi:MAG: 50S ribosomal protein L9 [Yaniella sp.]|uniref:50S ribosomal protein L9 n=1 Tax=Yaniella sp. TaxID=2773929 RepID=UPI0017F27221|nr:50S ribosomal protein L9 [Yaniella sp.]NLZ98868.1 50S ribosomal protein L9 [Micrococcus sp.]MDN5705280.1 50S ribosomal protein L9 [Yaniella sp.]MDN5730683.1 50S ribosomal protein L9 [Yaniella sp.]MDN5742703.1 50S ribosomal protein L9 [Yaniella sp.]MDN5815991.1 50S ribosomal protein L9 [Yaniella sp.]
MANQKVILTQEIPGLGSAGDVVDVRNGHARNYLIPRGEAVRWTQGAQQQVEQLRANREARQERSLEAAQAQAAQLAEAPIQVQMQAGDTGRLFGSVTTNAIVDAIAEAGKGDVDRRSVIGANDIRALGTYPIQIRLHEDVLAEAKVSVIPAPKK